MYVIPNFKTKKALKEAVAAGEHVFIWQPGPFGGGKPEDRSRTVEGPWFPEPHTWYAQVLTVHGKITKVT